MVARSITKRLRQTVGRASGACLRPAGYRGPWCDSTTLPDHQADPSSLPTGSASSLPSGPARAIFGRWTWSGAAELLASESTTEAAAHRVPAKRVVACGTGGHDGAGTFPPRDRDGSPVAAPPHPSAPRLGLGAGFPLLRDTLRSTGPKPRKAPTAVSGKWDDRDALAHPVTRL